MVRRCHVQQSCNYLIWSLFFFFFNDTATTEIYTLSLHDALPIYVDHSVENDVITSRSPGAARPPGGLYPDGIRSEEHTSELQSRLHLVCRLLLEKKKKQSAADYFDTMHLSYRTGSHKRIQPLPES